MNRWWERLSRLLEIEGGGERIRSMEGLRALAVTLVFFAHYESLFGAWVPAASAGAGAARFLDLIGPSGVDLFFVLSGYLIYGAVLGFKEQQGAYSRFMRRRVRRIYPTFLAILGIYLALSAFMPGESKLPARPGAALAYVLANMLLLPGIFRIEPIITVAWSLSYEVFFYAVLPLLVGGLGMRGWRPRGRVLAFLGLASAILVACICGAPHVKLSLFVSGILVYEACHSERLRRLVSGAGAQAVALFALAVYLPVAIALQTGGFAAPPVPYVLRTTWLFAALFAIALVAFRGAGPVKAAFSATPLRWLGNMSYSYYLAHGITLKAIAVAIARVRPGWSPGAAAHWALLPCAFAATLVTSAILFATVEKRFSLAPRPRLEPEPLGMAAAAR